ncbi:hypothetical protein G6F32_017442 [Rhizopus arrhizus]|nr:hypothetical protein G6F32_017442 [Rhizopus arrhizus]
MQERNHLAPVRNSKLDFDLTSLPRAFAIDPISEPYRIDTILSREDGGLLKNHVDRIVLVQAPVGNRKNIADNRKVLPHF